MEHFKDDRLAKDAQQLISIPVIWGVLPFLIMMDLVIEIYQHICFPLYGLECVDRSSYIKIDRQKLSYLNFRQRFACVYCGYTNGLFSYWVMIGATTEKYWCGIQHAADENFISPTHHKDFAKFGSKNDYEKKYKN
ncbi:hypothetical protein HOD19_03835 [bacterium]|jgi:hypothetical protein|nr:hypothetical protein [bacterium]MBT4648943.1 hypothetical protein [bacterium]